MSGLSSESRARMEKAWAERGIEPDIEGSPWWASAALRDEFEAGWVARDVEAEERQRELERDLNDSRRRERELEAEWEKEEERVRVLTEALTEAIAVAKRTGWDVDPEVQMILAPLHAALAVSSTENGEEQK